MKNIEIYKERMAKTMTREEKLFFFDRVDMMSYDTIIDFGGAGGLLVHEIQKEYPLLADKCHFIIVDSNPQMQDDYELKNCERVLSLKDIKQPLRRTMLICSSVLHECSNEDVLEINYFCKNYVQTVVMRDMAYLSDSPLKEADDNTARAVDAISKDKDYEARFCQSFDYSVRLGGGARKAITEFILKCDYVENWETEVKENYFSNNVLYLAMLLSSFDDFGLIYKWRYALPYKKEQAKRQFDFDLPYTHVQIILEKGKK